LYMILCAQFGNQGHYLPTRRTISGKKIKEMKTVVSCGGCLCQ
jgi:hypothetical protein